MQKKIFSKRTGWELSTNSIMHSLNEARGSGSEVLDLTISNPTKCGFDYDEDKIIKTFCKNENLLYAPDSQGLLSCRNIVSKYYEEKGIKVSGKNLFLSSSTSEGYSNVFRLLTNPGDEVMFPAPSYPLFHFLVDLNDVNMCNYNLVYDGEWKFDFDSIRNSISSKTKAIVIVSPNNPTGSMLSEDDVCKLNEICVEQSIPIICDEVFSDFMLKDDVKHRSMANNSDVLTFTLSGISKILGMPQMKLSWMNISGPQDLVDEAINRMDVIADTYLSVNTPIQNAFEGLIDLREDIQGQIIERIRNNLNFLKENANQGKNCEVLDASAGWYAVLKMPNAKAEEDWVIDLLKEDSVYVHPGYFYDFSDDGHIVLSLLAQESIFQQGVLRIMKKISL